MLEQHNPDLMRHMIEDHRARLMADNQFRHRTITTREPGRIRMSCGRLLIQLGERIRGAQPLAAEILAQRLAMGE